MSEKISQSKCSYQERFWTWALKMSISHLPVSASNFCSQRMCMAIDKRIQRDIAHYRELAIQANNCGDIARSRHYIKQMTTLIKCRSPRLVEKMEKERGLCK